MPSPLGRGRPAATAILYFVKHHYYQHNGFIRPEGGLLLRTYPAFFVSVFRLP
jgi:hypothetical protein